MTVYLVIYLPKKPYTYASGQPYMFAIALIRAFPPYLRYTVPFLQEQSHRTNSLARLFDTHNYSLVGKIISSHVQVRHTHPQQ